MNFSSDNCLRIRSTVDHKVSFARSIGTICIQRVCYAVVVHLCSCRVKDRRVLPHFSTAQQSCGLRRSFLLFGLQAVAHSLSSRVSLAEFYLSARELKYLGKIHIYLNTHIIFCINHSLNIVVSLKLHGLITGAVQQIVDVVIFLCLEDS